MTLKFPEEEDRGYRRGFDQGVAALARALGISSKSLQRTAFKRRVTDFRQGRLYYADTLWAVSEAEKAELRRLIS